MDSRICKHILLRNIDPDQQSPLVVLISWSNARKRQLLKYSKIYEEAGYTTLMILCKVYRLVLFNKSLFQRDTQKVINVIQDQICLNSDRKIIFQLFSAPGPAMFINIMNYFHNYLPRGFGANRYERRDDDIHPKIVGVIYDSCLVTLPSSREYGKGFKGTIRNKFLRTFGEYASRLFYHINTRNPMWRLWDQANRDIPGGYGQLFLSSKIDHIINHEKVVNFVEYRKACGEEIGYHIWDDSPHVLHLQKYPTEYRELVTNFCTSNLNKE